MVKERALARPSERSERFEPVVRGVTKYQWLAQNHHLFLSALPLNEFWQERSYFLCTLALH